MSAQILLLSGPLSVGKSSVARVLSDDYHFKKISTGDYLKGILAIRGLKETRQELQDLGDELDRETDFKWLVDPLAHDYIRSSSDQFHWHVDAVRKSQQVAHFRSAFSNVLHVHLNADDDILAARFAARGRESDFSHGLSSYQRAIERENEQAARALIHIADVVIDLTSRSPQEAAADIMRLL